MIILYGYGISNKSIERYLIKENILYQIVEDADESIVHFENVELIIKSPGINNDTLFIKKAHYFGIKIISDIEYLYSQIINNKKNVFKLLISVLQSAKFPISTMVWIGWQLLYRILCGKISR